MVLAGGQFQPVKGAIDEGDIGRFQGEPQKAVSAGIRVKDVQGPGGSMQSLFFPIQHSLLTAVYRPQSLCEASSEIQRHTKSNSPKCHYTEWPIRSWKICVKLSASLLVGSNLFYD